MDTRPDPPPPSPPELPTQRISDVPPASGAPTLPRAIARANVPARLGPYELVGELGQGGMGIVFRARHAQLGSDCAVKVLIAGEHASPEAIARFRREAASVAKMGKHPHIVTVHDLGEEGSLTYYAMELVEGESLRRRLAERPIAPREAALLLEKVARALHFAHAHGVIHRDVKPENIVVRADGEPQVMDFGLARDVASGQNLSVTGQVMGTPAYMSPEQARGEMSRTDARTDVYALGATLYEALAGIPPHAGNDLGEIFSRILHGDTVPPRRLRSGVPRDLETVCLKCLEVDPERRYATAEALADDLARFARGEPVRARRASLAERAWRKAIRHWTVALPSVASALLAIGFGAYALRAHLQRVDELGERVATETRLRHEAEQAKLALEKSYRVSTVLGRWAGLAEPIARMERVFYDASISLEEKRTRNEAAWDRVRAEFLEALPDDDASWVTKRALAGWARRLAGHPEEAEAWMREATERDPSIPYGALFRAMVLFCENADEQRLPPIVMGGSEGLAFQGTPAATPRMRARAERISPLIAQARAARVWGKEGAREYQAAMEAMAALQEGRYADSERGLTEAILGTELAPMRRSILLARGQVRYLLREFEKASEDLTSVLEGRPGQVDAWNERGLISHGMGEVAAMRGVDPRECLRNAISDYGEALRIAPGFAEAHVNRGNAWLDLGRAEEARGIDPRASFQASIVDCAEALTIDLGLTEAYNSRGLARLYLGDAEAARGIDPRGSYEKAIADFGEAVGRDPAYTLAWSNQGLAHWSLGRAQAVRGADPRESYKMAITSCGEALKRDPSYAGAYINRACAFQGLAESGTGDPRPDFERAIRDFEQAAKLSSGFPRVYVNLGDVYRKLGRWEEGAGLDPIGSYRKAIASCEEALKRNPEDALAYVCRAGAWQGLGDAEVARRIDPRASFEKAIVDCGEALRRSPGLVGALNNRGLALWGLGQAQAARGVDPRESYERGVADFLEAQKRSPGSWQFHANLGMLYETMGEPQKAVSEYEAALAIVGDNGPPLRDWIARAKAAAEKK